MKSVNIISPGRMNLIGEHTDYNMGYVLPAAIDLAMEIRMRINGEESQCRLYSKDLNSEAIYELRSGDIPRNSWVSYIGGVCALLMNRGVDLRGFDLEISSRIPGGAGLSSSAALECGVAKGLQALFGFEMEDPEIAALCQAAEQEYAGVQCGIMDQYACLMGRKDQAILLDCRSLENRYVNAVLPGYEWILLNSGVHHEHASSGYNQRRQECEEGLEILAAVNPLISSLRDVSKYELEAARSSMEDIVYKRCLYVSEENERVLKAAAALEEGDIQSLGLLMFESHKGISELYNASCPELDFLVNKALMLPAVAGARMTGGGFGGCSLNLVARSFAKAVISRMKKEYYKEFGLELEAYRVKASAGTSVE